MSRLSKKPITIEEGTNIKIEDHKATVSGPNGQLEIVLPEALKIEQNEQGIFLKAARKSEYSKVGLFRSLLNNAILGVKNKWKKTLELVGVGFRAQTDGKELTLNLGFSHPIKLTAPENISFEVKENKITVIGIDKYQVGETAASIRRLKKPEPYKGKGIKYENEVIRRKLGKAAKAVGGVK